MTAVRLPRRVLIAPDKFKGTLAAERVARAIAMGWKRQCPEDDLTLLPMSDGGDGFGEIIGSQLAGQRVYKRTLDASHKLRSVAWWWAGKSRIAIIESASVVGMSLFVSKQVHPFQLDTFGLGSLLKDAARREAKRCIVGLGGSATNDGGFGLARALGWKFLDAQGRPLQQWWQLRSLTKIIPPSISWRTPVIAATDVENLLLGRHGCSRVYGPQKGLSPEEVRYAEECLARLAMVYRKEFNRDFALTPGAGSAGGLGFGLVAFANAKIVSGFEIFAKATGLGQQIRNADLVITGEGRLDEQSLMGKAVGRVAQQCKKLGVPCIGLAGAIRNLPKRKSTFFLTAALTDVTSLKNALAHPERSLAILAERTARLWSRK